LMCWCEGHRACRTEECWCEGRRTCRTEESVDVLMWRTSSVQNRGVLMCWCEGHLSCRTEECWCLWFDCSFARLGVVFVTAATSVICCFTLCDGL